MKNASRQVEIALTAEQDPAWAEALTKFNLTSKTLRDYYDPPITPVANGKATMPYDPDIVLEMITILKQMDNVDPSIRHEISQKLSRVFADERMF